MRVVAYRSKSALSALEQTCSIGGASSGRQA